MPTNQLIYDVKMDIAQARSQAALLQRIFRADLQAVTIPALDQKLFTAAIADTRTLATEFQKITADSAQFAQNMQQAQAAAQRQAQAARSTSPFGDLTGAVAGGLAGYLTVQGIQAVGGQVIELSKLAAQAARTRDAYDNLAVGVGQNADAMLDAMRKASRGMISDADLIQAANRAMLLGVADSGEKLAQLLEVARVRGAAMGLSVTQAFNDLVTGLGRMSPLILDNLGIVTGGEAVFESFAESMGRTADTLTDAERKTALFNRVIEDTRPLLERSGGSATDAAGKFEHLQASMDNAKVAAGNFLLTIGVPEAVDTFAQAITDATTGLANFREEAIRTRTALGLNPLLNTLQLLPEGESNIEDIKGQIRGLENVLAGLEAGKKRLEADRGTGFFDQAGLDRQNELIREAAAQLGQLHAQLLIATGGANELSNGFYQLGSGADVAAPAITNLGRQVAVGSDHLRDGAVAALQMRDAINQLQSAASGRLAGVFSSASDLLGGGTQAFQAYQAADTQLQAQIDQWEAVGKSAEEIKFLSDDWIKQQSTIFSEQRRAVAATEREWKGAATSTAKAFDDAAAQLTSALRSTPGLFGTSQVTQGQLDLAQEGIPQNFADNWVRRLRDEVQNGKDWEGVSLDQAKEALGRVGIIASDNAETVVQQIADAWNNSTLFSDPANLALIDQEAVQANLDLQEKARQGQENILKHFGALVDNAVAAATTGNAASYISGGGATLPGRAVPVDTGGTLNAPYTVPVTVADTAMRDVTSQLFAQLAAEQAGVEALGGVIGGMLEIGFLRYDQKPMASEFVSGIAAGLAAQGDIIKGQGADYASIVGLGLAGYDFTTAASSAVVGLRGAFGTSANLDKMIGTGAAIGQFIADGITGHFAGEGNLDGVAATLFAKLLEAINEGV